MAKRKPVKKIKIPKRKTKQKGLSKKFIADFIAQIRAI